MQLVALESAAARRGWLALLFGGLASYTGRQTWRKYEDGTLKRILLQLESNSTVAMKTLEWGLEHAARLRDYWSDQLESARQAPLLRRLFSLRDPVGRVVTSHEALQETETAVTKIQGAMAAATSD